MLSDPERRRRYDLEARLQSRREWRRAAWGGAPQLHHAAGCLLPAPSAGALTLHSEGVVQLEDDEGSRQCSGHFTQWAGQ